MLLWPTCTTQALLSRSEEEAAANHPAFECRYHRTIDQVFMMKLSKFSGVIATDNMSSVQNMHVLFPCHPELLVTVSMLSLRALSSQAATVILVIPFLSVLPFPPNFLKLPSPFSFFLLSDPWRCTEPKSAVLLRDNKVFCSFLLFGGEQKMESVERIR